MAEVDVSADDLFEACANGDVASLQTLLGTPPYVAKALETEERIHDEELQLKRRSLNLLIMFNKAARAGSSDIIRYLLSFAQTHGVSYETLIHRDIICAAIASDNSVAVFKELHAVKPDLVKMDMGHVGTALGQAVSGTRNAPRYTSDRLDLVRFLLENGADPDQPHGPDRERPGTDLRCAVERSSIEVVELLIQHGAQIEQSGAMHRAAEKGRIDVMELLLKHGANVNEQLWTNLDYSASSRTNTKKEHGIISDVSDDRRPKWSHETPLHYSVLGLQIEAISWLVNHGADTDIRDSKDWSAKDMAVKMNDARILEALSSSGRDK
ncbi:ankyrin [Phaeosphaeriaceae sp. SRC1lsM3a]|nr:ankyrin [Stagonospora sp. SRC1lsM3a]